MRLLLGSSSKRFLVFLGFTIIAAACGKKSEDSPAPTPVVAAATPLTAGSQQAAVAGAPLPAANPAANPSAQSGPSVPGTQNGGSSPAPSGVPTNAGQIVVQAGTVQVLTPVTPGSTPPPLPLPLPPSGPQTFNIGINYSASVPKTMHLTEYATTAGTNGLSVMRISAVDDVFYSQNDSCSNSYDSVVIGADQEGTNYRYCNTTLSGPGGPGAKWLLGYFMAPNHLEIATDAHDVTPVNHTIIDIDVFSSVQPFKQGQSRFDFYCGNSGNSGITTTSVPMQYRFFNIPEAVPVAACTTSLQLGNNSALPTVNGGKLWVVSFFVDNSGFQVNCYTDSSIPSCAAFTSTTMTEVTVIISGNGSYNFTLPADAIKYAQELLFFPLPLLQSINPQN